MNDDFTQINNNINTDGFQPQRDRQHEFNYRPISQPSQTSAQVPPQTSYRRQSFNAPPQTNVSYSYAPQPQYIPAPQNIAPPMYGYYPYTPREIERESLRKSASKAGKATLAIFLLMQGLAIVLMMVVLFTGAMRETGEGDPYMGFSPSGFYLFEGMLSLVSIAVPTLIMLKASGERIDTLVPFSGINGKLLAAMTVSGMAICMLAQIVPTLFGINMSLFGIDIYENLNDSETAVSVMDFIMNTICTAVIPALVEEFAFRGLVLGVLRKHGDMFAVVTSAFLFGMLHGNFVQIPFAFIVGLVLGYVRVKTDSMLPSVLIHFGNNFFAVTMTYLSELLPENLSLICESLVVIILIIAGFAAIAFLGKNYREFFEYKSNKELKTLYSYKEKLQIFFSNGFVIADMIILTLAAVFYLFPMDEIMSSLT